MSLMGKLLFHRLLLKGAEEARHRRLSNLLMQKIPTRKQGFRVLSAQEFRGEAGA
jgi:hypothetical protein